MKQKSISLKFTASLVIELVTIALLIAAASEDLQWLLRSVLKRRVLTKSISVGQCRLPTIPAVQRRLPTFLFVMRRDAFAAEQQALEAQLAVFAAQQAALQSERNKLQSESERLTKLQQSLDEQAALEEEQAVAGPSPGLQAQLASLQDQVSRSSARAPQMGPQFHAPAQSAVAQHNPTLTKYCCYLVLSILLSSALLLGHQAKAGTTQMSTEHTSLS